MKNVLQNKTKTRFISSIILASILFALILPASSAFAQIVPTVSNYSTDVFNNATSGIKSAAPTDWKSGVGASSFTYAASLQFNDALATTKDGWKSIYTRMMPGDYGLYYAPDQYAGSFVLRATEEDSNKQTITSNQVVLPIPQKGSILSSEKQSYLDGVKNNTPSIVSNVFKYIDIPNQANSVTTAENLSGGNVIVNMPKPIAPGNYIKLELFFCAQQNANNLDTLSTGYQGKISPFADNAYGEVVTTGGESGFQDSIKNTYALQNSAGNALNVFDYKSSTPPCTSLYTPAPDSKRAMSNTFVSFLQKNTNTGTGWFDTLKNAFLSYNPLLKINPITNLLVYNDKTAPVVNGNYFSIGQPFELVISDTAAGTQTQINNNNTTAANGVTGQIANRASTDVLPSCSLSIWGSGGTFMGCIALFVYYVIFQPASAFAYLMGQIFDFFLGYSISSGAYTQPFIETMWGTLRDIANIFFIVIMIYVALMVVFTSAGNYKKIIGAVIINALLINFSLFFTRVVIDVSNITARLFYAQILVNDNNTGQPIESGKTGYKQISAAIISTFNPQKIFQSAFSDPSKGTGKSGGCGDTGSNCTNTATFNTANTTQSISDMYDKDPEKYAGYFTLVSLFAALIAFSTGLIFWGIAFIFIGRVIGLYIAMVFSPFAFMSRDIPFLNKLQDLSWSGWTKDLTMYAISAPLAVAYLFLVNQISQVNFFASKTANTGSGGTDLLTNILWIAIPMLIIYSLMQKGKKLIMEFAGSIGTQMQGYANQLGGLAAGVGLGVATGGAAIAGRTLIGGAAKGLQKTGVGSWLDRNQDNKYFGAAARMGTKTLTGAQNASYDLKRNELFKSGVSKVAGGMGLKNVNMNSSLVSFANLDEKNTEGGLKGQEKREKEKTKKEVSSIEVNASTDAQAEATWQKMQNANFLKKQNVYETQARAANNTLTGAQLTAEAKRLFDNDVKSKFGNVKTKEGLTQAIRQSYGNVLEDKTNAIPNILRSAGVGVGVGTVLQKVGATALTSGTGTLATAGVSMLNQQNKAEFQQQGASESVKARDKFIKVQNDLESQISKTSATIQQMGDEVRNANHGAHDLNLANQLTPYANDYSKAPEGVLEDLETHYKLYQENKISLSEQNLAQLRSTNTNGANNQDITDEQNTITADKAHLAKIKGVMSKRNNLQEKLKESIKASNNRV